MPITYEDMLSVSKWDDSKLIFKKVHNDDETQVQHQHFGNQTHQNNMLPQQQVTQKKASSEIEC
jgi:hypothetical protein